MNSSFQIKYTPKSCQPSTNLVIGDNLAYFDWWVEFSSRNVVIAGLIENSHIYCDFFLFVGLWATMCSSFKRIWAYKSVAK